MIGQLQNNFRKLVSIGALCAALNAPNIYADDIGGDQIDASTDLPIWGSFEIQQIADGIEPGPSGENGFTTNARTGIITLDFKGTLYDLDGFKLWNDVVLRAEGIKTFRLDFKTNVGGTLSSQIFEAAPRQPDVQIFTFPKVSNISSVDLVVLSSLKEPATATELPTFLERIEVREIAFTGVASNAVTTEENSATQIAGMEDYIDGLQNIIKGHEADKRELETELEKEKRRADSTFELLEQRDETITDLRAALSDNPTATTTLELLEEQKEKVVTLNTRIASLEQVKGRPNNITAVSGGVGFLGLGGLLGWLTAQWRRRQKKYEIGFIFPGSSMLSGPLPPTLASCQTVYDAVGRIGYAQDGKPTGKRKDMPMGTGILIAPNKILTNHHVFEKSKDKLTNDLNTGIEFYGERDSDKSDFFKIDKTIPPIPLQGFDALIFTLTEDVEHRTPVELINRPAEYLKDLEIVVVGYPYKRFHNDDLRQSTGEDRPIMGVKRYSEGKIFDHSRGRDKPYGVEASVQRYIHPRRHMRAICHNASTLPGNSGSAVICRESGKLIALHFGYDPSFKEGEATNFAIPGEDIAKEISETFLKL